MDAETSELRSGRRCRRRPLPPTRVPKHPGAPNAVQEVPSGSPSRRSAAALFSCSVCLETAREPVVTHCGHLFCWPCLYRWVRRHCPRGGCPVCKSTVVVEPGDDAGVTPIYGIGGGRDPVTGGGGGGGGGDDGPSLEVPPRPRGMRRPEPTEGTWPPGNPQGDALQAFREGLRDLSRDVDALDERMLQVMASVAQLRVPILNAYVREIAGQNDTSGASFVARGSIGVILGLQSSSSDGGSDGVYRGTRNRRRQTN